MDSSLAPRFVLNGIDKRKALKNEKNHFADLLSAHFEAMVVQGRTASKAIGWEYEDMFSCFSEHVVYRALHEAEPHVGLVDVALQAGSKGDADVVGLCQVVQRDVESLETVITQVAPAGICRAGSLFE